jgi:hypothetical protein
VPKQVSHRELASVGFGERDTPTEVAYALIVLALHHPQANVPDEPYTGVAALFNGDLHAGSPDWAPRDHWKVMSPFAIRHRSVKEILAEQRKDKAKKEKE